MGEENIKEQYKPFFLKKLKNKTWKGFNYGASKHDFFGTFPTFHFFYYLIAFSEFKCLVYK